MEEVELSSFMELELELVDVQLQPWLDELRNSGDYFAARVAGVRRISYWRGHRGCTLRLVLTGRSIEFGSLCEQWRGVYTHERATRVWLPLCGGEAAAYCAFAWWCRCRTWSLRPAGSDRTGDGELRCGKEGMLGLEMARPGAQWKMECGEWLTQRGQGE